MPNDLIKQQFMDDILDKKKALFAILPQSITQTMNASVFLSDYVYFPANINIITDIECIKLHAEIEEDIAKYHLYLSILENAKSINL